jgi:FtsP/CotA-like multicopper oxidase with cupredoxin domain
MSLRAMLLALLAMAGLMAAAPRDNAVIVNSGSTNTYGYTIEVWSDGSATAVLQRRGQSASATPKPFKVPAATVARFFANLAAARKGNALTVPCMKSASFGTSTHITWQGWTSPDLSCPPKDSLGDALVSDIAAIRQAAGIEELPLLHAGVPL